MKSIIIIGSGHAGYTLARELRKFDKTTSLLLVTADSGGAYSKPMLSNAFAQGKQAAQLVTQSATQMAAQLGAVIMTGTRVTGIDTANRKIETSGGVFEYGKLVLAVGAQPIRLPLQGDAADSVMSVNHVDDYARFRSRLARHEPDGCARIAILGAGLIGCEFADDLAGAGHAVTLIDPNPLPLAALAPPALSRGLQAALAERGVTLRLGTTAARIDHSADALQLTLADGSTVEADVVLSAVGLRADLRLAQAAQLATGRGITLDVFGQASAPDVYALGDCAEYTDHADGSRRTLPYIAPLMTAARSIARTLTGQATPIELKAAPVIVKTPSYPLALIPAPAALNASGVWRTAEFGGRMICRFHDSNGVLLGFGVAPHDASVRQALLAELGSSLDAAA
jgi:rubredoxin---NAD+ reductase